MAGSATVVIVPSRMIMSIPMQSTMSAIQRELSLGVAAVMRSSSRRPYEVRP
jgi:hypothetical protein